ncbi:MAG: prepilin-type N-terminal cleavage/methylation domain-containing protein [Candidatus Omnitrophica bacterium]|nr:prepilin-type N-terminal cleavage/methylation domain-containing protein [Candidatus Omnitrophota bacterium]MDD5429778.1 prepilin-type N-terminal cleavage/methylation domain-containing protein [Candidatus Omnitrophota bacterium]
MRKGFTLLELLIVVIVVGILATIAIPQFLTSVEKARVAKAKNALGLISHAEKMYRAENDEYVALEVSGDDDTALDNYIELDQIRNDNDWNYVVTSTEATIFTITATKEGGAYAGATITLDQDGVCGPQEGDAGHPLRGRDCGAE